MLALDGYRLGLAFRVLDPKPRVSASKVCAQITAGYDDRAALAELADWSDLVTYEFENVPTESVEEIREETPVSPHPRALEHTSDRLREKRLFRDLGIPTTEFEPVESPEELAAVAREMGRPLVVKSRRMGYDGKGQARIEPGDDPEDVWRDVGASPSIAEAKVDFDRELSIVGVRAHDGSIRTYPLVENIHRDGILVSTLAPAPDRSENDQQRAETACRELLEELDYVGTLALELFDTGDELLANEYAPRVHNSGHWSIEGARTSQFANHVRAVAGYSLGETGAVGHTRMVNVIGNWPDRSDLLEGPCVDIHDYEKQPRPGRKIGHTTVHAEEPSEADRLADRLRDIVKLQRDLGN
jgi:5-(carboxyamino)imidazole ribonucleotide synthase